MDSESLWQCLLLPFPRLTFKLHLRQKGTLFWWLRSARWLIKVYLINWLKTVVEHSPTDTPPISLSATLQK